MPKQSEKDMEVYIQDQKKFEVETTAQNYLYSIAAPAIQYNTTINLIPNQKQYTTQNEKILKQHNLQHETAASTATKHFERTPLLKLN